ncbi:MAG: hypothetical protein Kow0077_27000 [Anaerolineae bacterium]
MLMPAAAPTRKIPAASGLLVENPNRVATDKLHTLHIEVAGQEHTYPVPGTAEILLGRGFVADDSTDFLDLSSVDGGEKGVSRRHAVIRIEGLSVYLVDIGSTNGTFLNGRRIHPEHRHVLYSGDRIRLGALELQIRFS